MNTSYIDDIFDDYTGALARLLPGYARREGQVRLAEAVDHAIENNSVLVGEAPCGTGKSFAYLAPAVVHAIRKKRPVLIVTANKALQEQLMEKDLPLLAQALTAIDPAFTFDYTLLKGRANYLCRNQMHAFDMGLPMPGFSLDDATEAHALSAWAMQTMSGEQADAPPVALKVWNAFTVSGDRCERKSCSFYDHCFAEHALVNAERALVVVANYDLFFSKILYSGEAMWARFSTVIFDEAHEAPNIARRCFGSEIGYGHLSQLAGDVGKYFGDHGMARDLRQRAEKFFDEVMRYALKHDNEPRIREKNCANSLEVVDILDDVMRAAKGNCGSCDNPARCKTCAQRTLMLKRAERYIKQIHEVMALHDDTTAYWIDKPSDYKRITAQTVRLKAVPYRVGRHLAENVFDRYPCTIAVSATLTTGNNFDFILDELGLRNNGTAGASTKRGRDVGIDDEETPVDDGDDTDEPRTKAYKPRARTFALYKSKTDTAATNVRGLQVRSPFNFATQAKMIVPANVPFPIAENDEIYNKTIAQHIDQLIRDMKGRTLILFTSWRRLQYVAEYLRDNNCEYPLLVQGELPNKTMTQMFRDQVDSVMLATKSFWIGLDVQGESLTCLVIDKLPLESFSDPLIDMMKEKHPNEFWDRFYYPRAAIELAQGAGRLIRSVNDKGVFVLFDLRILAKSYGGLMRRSLPFAGVSNQLADAGKFINI